MNTVWFHLQEVSRGVKSMQTERRWSRAGDLRCHAQTTHLGKMRMALEMEIGNSCITMWMNVVYLNCAPKNAQNGRFYVVCVLPPIFKSCRDSKGLSRNTALGRRYLPPSPGFITCSLWISGCLRDYVQITWQFCGESHRLSEGLWVQEPCWGPLLCRGHLPISSLPSPNPPFPFTRCLNTMQRIFLNLGFIRQGLIS